jgi:saccharopine dehydrogenase-like NADP-dependent oxidoreductase
VEPAPLAVGLVLGLILTTDFQVVIAGRNRDRAQAFVDEVQAVQSTQRALAAQIDVKTVTAQELQATGAFVVVDAAGPFQTGNYRLVEAAMAARLHYLDLADARGFASGFSQLDAEARAAGIIALTGASSTPALSNAVLDRLTCGWQAIHSVEIAIAPGNRAPTGLSVIRSILSCPMPASPCACSKMAHGYSDPDGA